MEVVLEMVINIESAGILSISSTQSMREGGMRMYLILRRKIQILKKENIQHKGSTTSIMIRLIQALSGSRSSLRVLIILSKCEVSLSRVFSSNLSADLSCSARSLALYSGSTDSIVTYFNVVLGLDLLFVGQQERW